MTGFDIDRFCAHAMKLGHGGALGIGLGAHGPDWVELTLPYDERFVGDVERGVLASAPIVSMMDMATSLAVWQRLGSFRQVATLDLRVDYLRPAAPHRTVIGRGECVRLTRSIAFVRGTAHDGDPDDLVATVAGTFMLLQAAA